MVLADKLRCTPWVAAGIPETAGHPWWLDWAAAAMSGEASGREELDETARAFAGKNGG